MFYVGQKVVCVDDVVDQGKEWHGPALVRGQVYTIRDFTESYYGKAEVCIRVCEIIRGEHDWAGFRAHRFRPIVEKKTDISIFEEILRRETIDDRAPVEPL